LQLDFARLGPYGASWSGPRVGQQVSLLRGDVPGASNEEARLTGFDNSATDALGSAGGPERPIEPEHIASLGIQAVVQLVARAVATRAITLIGTIALARLLTPEQFGIFAVTTFAVVLLSLIGDTGIGGALIQQTHRPTERELATALTFQIAIWTIVLVATWVLAILLPIVAPDLPSSSADLIRLLGVAAWLSGVRAIPTMMLTRVIRFGPQAAMEIAQQVIYFGVAVVLAAFGFGALSFGIAAVAQSLVATVGLWLVFGHWPGFGFELAIARRMWGFGVSFQLSYVLYWARESVVAVFGGLAGGLSAVGLTQFGWRNGQFALSVEEIVARVAFPAFSRLQANPRQLGAIAGAAIEAGFLASAIIQGWLAATAPALVPIVFSDAWIPALHVFQLVCLGSLAWGPVLILRELVYARGDSDRGLRLAAFNVGLLYIVFPIFALSLGLTGAGIAYVVSSCVGLLVYVRATRSAIVFPWLSIARITTEMVLAGIAAALVVESVGGIIGLGLSAIAYLVVFGALVAAFERALIERLVTHSRGPDARLSP